MRYSSCASLASELRVLINEVMEKDGHSLLCYPPTRVAPCGAMTQNILV